MTALKPETVDRSKFLITWRTNETRRTDSGGCIHKTAYRIIGPCSVKEANERSSELKSLENFHGSLCGCEVPLAASGAHDEWGVWTIFDGDGRELMRADLLIGELHNGPAIFNPTGHEHEYHGI